MIDYYLKQDNVVNGDLELDVLHFKKLKMFPNTLKNVIIIDPTLIIGNFSNLYSNFLVGKLLKL